MNAYQSFGKRIAAIGFTGLATLVIACSQIDLSKLTPFERSLYEARRFRELVHIPQGEYEGKLVTILGGSGSVLYGAIFDKTKDEYDLEGANRFGGHITTRSLGDGPRDEIIKRIIDAVKKQEGFHVNEEYYNFFEVTELAKDGKILGYFAVVDRQGLVQDIVKEGNHKVYFVPSTDFTTKTGATGGGGGGGGGGSGGSGQ